MAAAKRAGHSATDNRVKAKRGASAMARPVLLCRARGLEHQDHDFSLFSGKPKALTKVAQAFSYMPML
jgi:hypothetical protein